VIPKKQGQWKQVKLLLSRTGAAWQWSLSGNTPFREELEGLEKPLLWDKEQMGNSSLVIGTKNGTWVDLIFVVTNSGGLQ